MANTTATTAPARGAKPGTGAVAISGRRRRYNVLTRRDKILLALMVGIPLALDIILIWGPTVA